MYTGSTITSYNYTFCVLPLPLQIFIYHLASLAFISSGVVSSWCMLNELFYTKRIIPMQPFPCKLSWNTNMTVNYCYSAQIKDDHLSDHVLI